MPQRFRLSLLAAGLLIAASPAAAGPIADKNLSCTSRRPT
jgi:hypothetical protein